MKQCTYVDTKYMLYAVIVTVVVLGWYFDEGKLLCWCRHEEEVCRTASSRRSHTTPCYRGVEKPKATQIYSLQKAELGREELSDTPRHARIRQNRFESSKEA